MPRTQDRFYADAPHTGGFLWANARDLGVVSNGADPLLTRNAQGDWSLNRTAIAAETVQAVINLAAIKRLNEPVDLQEQFGGSVSVPPGQFGRPPFTGASQLDPQTTWSTKGARIQDVVVVYQVGVVALTSAALRLDGVTFVDVTAPAVVTIPIDATALALTIDANPRLAVRAVTTPAFIETDNNDVILEFEAVMANTGTLRIYALGLHVSFNYD